MDIADIREKLSNGQFEYSRHALRRAVEREIRDNEIIEAGAAAELIENYPDDKYSPSCLALGFTKSGRPLHLQVCYTDSDTLKIVTIYEPDNVQWADCRIRRSP